VSRPAAAGDAPAPRDPEAASRLLAWQEYALELVLRIGAASSVATMTFLTWALVGEGTNSVKVFGWALVLLLVAVTLARPVPARVRAYVYLLGAVGGLLGSVPLFGFSAAWVVMLLDGVILAVVLLGPWQGVALGAVIVLALAGLELLPAEILAHGALLTSRYHLGESPLLTAVAVLPSVGQTVVGVILALRGLRQGFTETLRALRVAEANEQRFRGIFDASPDVVTLVSVPGEIILDANAAFERVFGWRRAEAIGKTPAQLGIVPRREPPWAERVGAREQLDGVELEITRRDGELLRVELSIRLTELEGQRVAIVVARDVTPQRRLTAGLRQVQRVEAMGSLAAGIAHNFRNALGTVVPTLDYCLSEAPDALRPALADARHSAAAAVELAADLTRLSRGEAAGPLERVDVLAVLREVVAVCRRTFGSRVTVEDEGLLGEAFVTGNAGALRHAFLNLCINARDAMGNARGRLLVSAAPSGAAGLTVEVRDDGPGMPPEVVRRLGEPFFTTKPEGQGTGLGVSTAMAAAREAGGRVRVVSAPGQGTSFYVELPLARGQAPAAPSRVVLGTGRVLVACAEPELLQALGRQLEGLSLECTLTGGASGAVAALQETPSGYQLLIADAELRVLSGATLAAASRLLAPELRVIAIVPDGATERPQDIDVVLARPVGTYELAAAIARTWGIERQA